MRLPFSRFASKAMAFFIASALLTGCSGSQTPSVPTATDVASVSRSTQLVSPDGIVYTPVRPNVQIENSQYNLDLNNDGTTDFIITESNTTRQPICNPPRGGKDEFATLSLATSQSTNAFEFNNGYVARVTSGSPIGPSQSFAFGSAVMEHTSIEFERFGSLCKGYTLAEGNWSNGDRGYLGLAFVIRGKTHYGWAAIGVPYGYYGFLVAKLKGYAYQTIAGKAIKAGQM